MAVKSSSRSSKSAKATAAEKAVAVDQAQEVVAVQAEPPCETPPPSVVVETAGEADSRNAPRPKYSYSRLAPKIISDLRKVAKDLGVSGFSSLRKDDLIVAILKSQADAMNFRFGGGTLEVLAEGYGFLRPKGLLPSDNDVYVSSSQIRRFGLRNGDVIWGFVRPPKDQEHYEALLRVEMVNFSDPEAARKRPQFGALTPIFPDRKSVV